MAEFPGNSFLVTEECRQCGTRPAVFLHHVLHKGHLLHVCTACVLRLHQGSFCPICFTVYEDQYNLSNDHVKCSSCEAIYHFHCIPSLSTFFSIQPPTAPSTSTAPQNYRVVCPYCSSPDYKIFNFRRDERTGSVKIDRNSTPQILAAAIISDRSMKKAAKIASVKAQIMCKEAGEAKKEAKDALKKLHDLTVSDQAGDSNSEYVSDDDDGGNEASNEESM